MDRNKTSSVKKLSNPQFKKRGGTKRANRSYPNHEPSSENAQVSGTIYNVLSQTKRIGSVIGKCGNIIKSLREETPARITVADSVPGSDERERERIISSSSTKLAGRTNSDHSKEKQVTREENEGVEPHCAAQDALLKVHDRIVEEDLGRAADENSKEIVVTNSLYSPCCKQFGGMSFRKKRQYYSEIEG